MCAYAHARGVWREGVHHSLLPISDQKSGSFIHIKVGGNERRRGELTGMEMSTPDVEC